MKAAFTKYTLNFNRPGGTSRGVLTAKETFFLVIKDQGRLGIGECGLFRGLSADDVPNYEEKGQWVAKNIGLGKEALLSELNSFPSLQFGVEQAFRSIEVNNTFNLFESDFLKGTRPIPINGLVWMGNEDFMRQQIDEKLQQGFHCIKMKIGALDFKKEVALLRNIRKRYTADKIELRVDANGAFSYTEALERLKVLAQLQIHSIEQPIKAGQWENMKKLCQESPLPIALDEELIGVFNVTQKEELLQTIKPDYIILKPSLVGGFGGSNEWINLAEQNNMGWWVTSALESNIGLNAIAQWTATLNNALPQGLGTGGLFTNNIDSPLRVENGGLFYKPSLTWDLNKIKGICI